MHHPFRVTVASVLGASLLALVAGCGGGRGSRRPGTDAGPRRDAPGAPDAAGDAAADAAFDAPPRPDAFAPCTNDGDCIDSLFCNGAERCAPGDPEADARGCAPGTSPCLPGQTCDEGMGRCTTVCAGGDDADADGHPSTDCGGDDCNDTDPAIHPGATERCDALDDDCDGLLDGPGEDDDGDGHADRACGLRGDDCDDEDPTTYVDAPELCDLLDNDCGRGGGTDRAEDQDADGYAPSTGICSGGPLPATDCNDLYASAHPGGMEVCNGVDDDCDGSTDEATDSTCGLAHSTSVCRMGTCTIVTCDAGFSDCDASPTDGCEVEPAVDELNCGACGAVCIDGATCTAGACRPRYVWDRESSGPGTDLVGGLATDTAGNLYAGVHAGRVDLGGGPIDGPAFGGVFVASFTPANVHRWSHLVSTTSQAFVHGVAVDGAGNVYVAGEFLGAITFAGMTRTSSGIEDAFVVSYDSGGLERWLVTFGGTDRDDARSIAVDGAGNVYVAGRVEGAIDFGGGVRPGLGGEDVYVASYSSAGAHRWSTIHGGPSIDALPFVAATGVGDVLLGAQFSATASFGGMPLTSVGATDVVVARYDTLGGHQWSQRFGTAAADRVRAIAVDAATRVFLGGDAGGGIDFGGGALPAAAIGYVASLDGAGGAHRWSIPIRGMAISDVGLAAGGTGGVLVAATAIGMVQFGTGRIVGSPATGFLVDVSPAGVVDLTLRLGRGTDGTASADYVTRGAGTRIYTGGVLRASVDFGGGLRTSDAAGDLYLLALDW